MLKPHAPAAARTVAAQIIQLKKLHRMRQLFQIRLNLGRIHHVIHDAHTEFHTRNHALNLPRVRDGSIAPDGVFRLDLRQADFTELVVVDDEAIRKLQPNAGQAPQNQTGAESLRRPRRIPACC